MNQTKTLQEKPFDADEWQKLYYRHQQQYIRNRLDAIKLLQQGKTRQQVCEEIGCSYDTLTSWIKKYLNGGLKELVSPIRHQKPSRLTPEQQQELKIMVLTQLPTDYGIDRYIWTGAILSEVIEQRFGVQLKDSRIYELLSELGLSYQRAHRDYANADLEAQKAWVEHIKQKLEAQKPTERIAFFDEFAVYDRPSLFYGWAERNTRPEIPSNERRRNKLNGFLCVDALSGEEFFRLSAGAKTEDVSKYLSELSWDSLQQGYTHLSIILDNNPTHKQKMETQLRLQLQEMGIAEQITVELLYTPAYSPKLNLVEYVIHLLRLRFLHHLPLGMTLADIECKLKEFLASHQFLSAEQVQKTLNHIFSLIA